MKMNRLVALWIVLGWFLLTSIPVYAENGLVRVSEHVYSYLDIQNASPANSYGANAGIIIGEDGIAVVDTLISAKEAKRFLGDIRMITDKPIKYVINTHYHLDHSFGNSVFADLGASIIAHANCDEAMREKGETALANAEKYGLTQEDLAGTKIAYPDITFTDRYQLNLGSMEVELIYNGPSHSKGSIIAYVPQEKTVFTGDILFTDFHPYMGDDDIVGWLKNLNFLAALDADNFIPGHGRLSTKKDVADMKSYITIFDTLATEAAAVYRDIDVIEKELKKSLPVKAQGEWMIRSNIQTKYLRNGGN